MNQITYPGTTVPHEFTLLEADGTLTATGQMLAFKRLDGKGGFADALADALSRADSSNQRRLIAAFPELLLGKEIGGICDEAKEMAAGIHLSDTGSFESFAQLFDAMTFKNDFFEVNNVVIWGPYENDDPSDVQRGISDMAENIQQVVNTEKGFVVTNAQVVKTIHPIDAASMERTALEINNEIRGDLQLVARANGLAKQYLKDHGFSVDDGVPS